MIFLENDSLRDVMDAIASRDLARLGAFPLAQLQAVIQQRLADRLPDTDLGRGQAARQVIEQAIEDLRPADPDADDMTWRPYRVLKAMLAGRGRLRLAQDFNLSVDGLKLAMRERVWPALRSALWEREQAARQANRSEWLSRHLPPPTYSRLFGVEARLAQLQQAIAPTGGPGLILLTGLGGLGKTALAREMARSAAAGDYYADIAWVTMRHETHTWDHMSDSTRPALSFDTLLDLLADQLGYPDLARRPAENKLAGLRTILHNQPHLVVVDDLETGAEVDHLAPKLVELSGPSRYVLTSRYWSAIPGPARVLRLDELPWPDALALIRYEAGERGLIELAEAPEVDLRAIYEVVGGHPLALKLIIGQTAILPLHLALAQLRQSDTDHSLYSYLYRRAWSLLSVDAQLVLQAMAVLPTTGATWDDLLDLSELPEDRLGRALLELVGLSLITVGGGVTKRYLIHRLTYQFLAGDPAGYRPQLRQRAAQRILRIVREHHADPAAVDRHRDYAFQSLEDLAQSEQPEAQAALIEITLILHPYMVQMGQWQSWSIYLEAAAAAAHRLRRPATEAAVLRRLGEITRLLGDLPRARQVGEQALALLGQEASSEQVATLLHLARTYRALGNADLAVRTAEGALALASEPPDQAQALLIVGEANARSGRHDAARSALQRVLEMTGPGGDPAVLGQTYNTLGYLAFQQSDLETARTYMTHMLQACERQGDVARMGQAHANLAAIYGMQGDAQHCREHLERALPLAETAGDVETIGNILSNLGVMFTEIGQFAQANDYLERALHIGRTLGNPAYLARILGNLGDLRREQGRFTEALEYGQQAISYADSAKDVRDRALYRLYLARSERLAGNTDRAGLLVSQARELAEQLGNDELSADIAQLASLLALDAEQYNQAIAHVTKATALRGDQGPLWKRLMDSVILGQAYLALGDFQGLKQLVLLAGPLIHESERPDVTAHFYLLLADWALSSGRSDQAGQAYSRALIAVRSAEDERSHSAVASLSHYLDAICVSLTSEDWREFEAAWHQTWEDEAGRA